MNSPILNNSQGFKWLSVFISIYVIISASFLVTPVCSEKILVVSFFCTKSQKNVVEPLIQELANRGHKITVISPIKSSRSHENVSEIIGMTHEDLKIAVPADLLTFREKNKFFNPMNTDNFLGVTCRHYYENPEVQQIQKEKFDLVIGNSFMNECSYGFIYKMNTTFMFVHPQAPAAWTSVITGAPTLPSFIPLPYFGFTHDMNFKDRFYNFMTQINLIFLNEVRLLPILQALYRDYLGENIPSVHEIEKEASLMLINSHFGITYPRPYMPDQIEIGGMHCRPGKPLPKDIEDFIDGSGDEGFIYFSMGSVVSAHLMSERYRKALVNAFSKLKQRVIWKWETGEMADTPANVMLGKWLPQQDILAHPKIRLFITHGGLLSTEEAVYHAVPLVGIPIFSDQDWNMKQSENNGFALTLEFRDLTEETILKAVNRILNEPQFGEKVKLLSSIFRDRPQKPLDTAVYWTEYVMRHKGARHLRSPARDLNFFQYFSLDVIAFAIALLLIVLYTSYRILACIAGILCSQKSKKSSIALKKAQ